MQKTNEYDKYWGFFAEIGEKSFFLQNQNNLPEKLKNEIRNWLVKLWKNKNI